MTMRGFIGGHPQRRQAGYVLVTSLIFLVVLTLVAVVATKNTTMQLKMSRNFVEKASAFEGSEVARLQANDITDAMMFNRGWPVNCGSTACGGTVSTADWGNKPWPATMTLLSGAATPTNLQAASSTNTPQSLYSSNAAAASWCTPAVPSISCFAPTIEYQYSPSGDTTYNNPGDIAAIISIFRLGVFNNAGSGSAMIAGYEGTGKGAASSGSNLLFYLKSEDLIGGLTSPSGTVAYTGAYFQDTIRN
jgi:hypothetical protein